MIATVLNPLDAGSITGNCCSREELLHKASAATMKALHENPITLANLTEVRSSGERGRLAASNRLFSLDESVQELASLKKDEGGLIIMECSERSDGRDPSGLAEISRRSGVSIVMAASAKQTDGTAPQPAPDSIGKDLEHQLLFGEHGSPSHSHSAPTTAAAPADGAASRIQAGFILVKLYDSNSSYPLHQGSTEATTAAPAESALLAHGDSSIAGGTSAVLEGAVKAQHTTGAPLMLAFSHFVRWPRVKATLEMIAEQQRDTADAGTCASGSRPVIVAGMHGGVSQSLPDQAALLSNTKGVVLCFDCFGRVEWSPGSDYYPSDEESAVRIAELVRRGFAERIVISSGVSRRIHLSRFGGHGYGHALRTIPPRLLRLGVSAEDVALMTRTNMLRLLDWYSPPPPMEIPKDYLPCSWCQKRFEPVEGEYFHKFQFVYCRSKCLRGHRDTGFGADAVAKPTV